MKTGMLWIGLASCLASVAHAALVSYTFETGVATPATFTVDATSFAISVGSFSYGAGYAPTAASAISDNDWRGVEGSKWWEFTATPPSGSLLYLTSISLDDQRSATGPGQWSVSINGISAMSGQDTHASFARSTVDLSGAAYQGLSSATVRISGYNGSSSGGTWRLDNVVLEGATAVVPEPAGGALMAAGGLLVAALARWSMRPNQ